MLQLQRFNLFLCGFGNQAFAMQLAVGTRMRLIAWRQKVSGDVTLGCNICDNLDFFVHVGQLGEKFGFGVALKEIRSDLVARLISGFQAVCVSLVQEYLSFQNLARLNR